MHLLILWLQIQRLGWVWGFNRWMRVMEGKGLEGEEGTLLSLLVVCLSLSLTKLWVWLAYMEHPPVYTSLGPIPPINKWHVRFGKWCGDLFWTFITKIYISKKKSITHATEFTNDRTYQRKRVLLVLAYLYAITHRTAGCN